jgi:glycine C-acetyltransferase
MTTTLNTRLADDLAALRAAGTYKTLQYLDSPMAARAEVENRGETTILCSNNYIGLSDKQELINAAKAALDKYGAGAASVRFICGTFTIHRQLEEKVAQFLHTEASLTYASCWCANTALVPAIIGPGDAVISDELNHASIIDACRMAHKDAKKMIYKHADMASLEEKLRLATDAGCPVKLVITDGVFSMEGDIALLPQICELAKKYQATVMVDESHATGVLGKTGRGTMEYYDMLGQVDIITGTFGKALGGAGGGFVAGSRDLIDILVQRSRPHLFSNSLPPVLSAIALAAIEYLEQHPEITDSLRAKTVYMRDALIAKGLKPLEGDSAIIPLIVGDTALSISVAGEMLKQGIHAIGFGFPVVPEGTARIRIQVSDALSYQEIDRAVEIISNICPVVEE